MILKRDFSNMSSFNRQVKLKVKIYIVKRRGGSDGTYDLPRGEHLEFFALVFVIISCSYEITAVINGEKTFFVNDIWNLVVDLLMAAVQKRLGHYELEGIQ
jgi:hypothetical protein